MVTAIISQKEINNERTKLLLLIITQVKEDDGLVRVMAEKQGEDHDLRLIWTKVKHSGWRLTPRILVCMKVWELVSASERGQSLSIVNLRGFGIT